MRDHLGRLDPVGRRWLPRRPMLLRLLAVAGLLLTAVAVLQTGPREAAAPAAATSAPPAPPGVADATAGAAGAAASAGAAAPAAPAPRLPIPAGLVGVPVRLADPTGLAVLVPGDRVDLLAVPAQGPPTPLASAAPVLAVDRSAAALLLALPPAEAKLVVASPPEHPLAIIVR